MRLKITVHKAEGTDMVISGPGAGGTTSSKQVIGGAVAGIFDDSMGQGLDVMEPGHRVEIAVIINPYRPDGRCKYRPLPGNKYVLVTVAITNTDVMPVVASFSDFRIECERGRKYKPVWMPDMDDDFGAARCPAPGVTETGTLLFEVPLIAEIVSFLEYIDGSERCIDLPGESGEIVA